MIPTINLQPINPIPPSPIFELDPKEGGIFAFPLENRVLRMVGAVGFEPTTSTSRT